jgi:uncharacterized glyoxalase superfamily protein PhnB
MATQAVPVGFHTVTPFILVKSVQPMLDFVKKAFGAEIGGVMHMPDGQIAHAEVKIGDSMIMFGGSMEDEPTRSSTYLYVENCDEVYQRALEAGGKSVQEPKDQFYGDRNAGVSDPFGNQWWIGTHIEDVSHEALEARMARMYQDGPRD